jgi:hypothetical protein
MPKRKIPDSLLPPDVETATLALIKEAHRHPHYLTADEERDFLERRAHGHITRHETIITERRGKLVYREPGKAGADLPVPPFYHRMLVARRDFEAQCAKVDRALRLRYWTAPRAAAARAQRIREIAAATPAGRGRIKAIARAAGVDVRTVRRALKK